MKDLDILKDIMQFRISNQINYNEDLLIIRNPEVRQILTQLRDDETRSIVKLQQRIERLESTSGIISKIFTSKKNY